MADQERAEDGVGQEQRQRRQYPDRFPDLDDHVELDDRDDDEEDDEESHHFSLETRPHRPAKTSAACSSSASESSIPSATAMTSSIES